MSAAQMVECDAGTVYAEGMRNGLRTAISMCARSGHPVPRSLRKELTAWTAHAIHREWLVGQGRAVEVAESAVVMAQIHVVLGQIGRGWVDGN